MTDSSKITSDQLFVGLALPPTLLGAPYPFTVFSLMLTAIFFVLIKNPLTLLCGIPFIVLGRWLTSWDPYAIQTLSQFSIMRSRLTRNAVNWRAGTRKVVTVSPWDYHTGNTHKKKKYE